MYRVLRFDSSVLLALGLPLCRRVHTVRLSASISTALTGRISVKFDSGGDLMKKIGPETRFWLKSGETLGHFT